MSLLNFSFVRADWFHPGMGRVPRRALPVAFGVALAQPGSSELVAKLLDVRARLAPGEFGLELPAVCPRQRRRVDQCHATRSAALGISCLLDRVEQCQHGSP